MPVFVLFNRKATDGSLRKKFCGVIKDKTGDEVDRAENEVRI